MATETRTQTDALYIELDTQRKIRHRNKLLLPLQSLADLDLRLLHRARAARRSICSSAASTRGWPCGWRSCSSAPASPGCAAGCPGCEPRPYIIRFTEDRPNPLYRRVCYTTAWGEVVAFAVLNIAGLAYAVVTGEWRLKQMYEVGLLSDRRHDVAARRVRLAAAREARRRRAKDTSAATSTARCGRSRSRSRCCGCCGRCCRQTRAGDALKLVVFVGILVVVGPHVAPRAAAAHAADRARRVGGLGLACRCAIDVPT